MPVHPGCCGTLVTPHPIPPNQQEGGIGDEVVQIVEPAMRIITGPTVQLGLDLQYPLLRLVQGGLQLVGIHRRNLLTFLSRPLLTCWPPWPCGPALPASTTGRQSRDYYGASAPPTAINRQRTCPPPHWMSGGRATADGSHVHGSSIGQGGAQLYSGSIATPTPQAFSVASPPAFKPGYGVDNPRLTTCAVTHCDPAHIHQVGAGRSGYGASDTGSLALRLLTSLDRPEPSGSSDSTRRCRGCSPPPRRSPVQGAPSFNPVAATTRWRRSLTSTR